MLDAAQGQPCVLCQFDHIENDITTVPAHLPGSIYGMPAGMGEKTHDWLVGHVCDPHHAYLDSEKGRRNIQIRMLALCLTLQRLFEQGVIVVKS